MAIALVTLLASAPAWSSGDGDLWIFPVASACMAQYPELSSTQLGTALQQAPQIAAHISAAKAAFASLVEQFPQLWAAPDEAKRQRAADTCFRSPWQKFVPSKPKAW